jgi:hypothetical protein
MRGSEFDEISFFSAIEASGARALLIGRRAPAIDDLILTKRFAARPKDAEDIRLLERLKEARDE